MIQTILILKECGLRIALALAVFVGGVYALAEAIRTPTASEAAAAATIEAFAKPVVSTAMVGWVGAAACLVGLVLLAVEVREARRWVSVE